MQISPASYSGLSILPFQGRDPGSIPGVGNFFCYFQAENWKQMTLFCAFIALNVYKWGIFISKCVFYWCLMTFRPRKCVKTYENDEHLIIFDSSSFFCSPHHHQHQHYQSTYTNILTFNKQQNQNIHWECHIVDIVSVYGTESPGFDSQHSLFNFTVNTYI